MTTQEPLPLPGLEEVAGSRGADQVELAIRRTIVELHRQGHVHEVDAGKLALAIELAQIVSLKRRTGRVSTVGHDARVLMEILDSFVEEATDADGQLQAAMQEWSEAVAEERHAGDPP